LGNIHDDLDVQDHRWFDTNPEKLLKFRIRSVYKGFKNPR